MAYRVSDGQIEALTWQHTPLNIMLHAGTFTAEDYSPYSYMKPGGSTLAMDDKLVPADVVALVKAKEKEILDGTFVVKVNDAEPKSS